MICSEIVTDSKVDTEVYFKDFIFCKVLNADVLVIIGF